ncbi:DNase I-like protein [Cristinia sonorae]|uniref:DNA-(apurinic or apyrimidinic site) endonuclease n=1 Tax=Cristinia sonorae TaxID=1940300 RepID=A0A8K0UTK3_9AGAR|nr:DNase I-like protein [Cristinia sonorae]
MRILSWNINAIRTLPQYHPWNAFKNCAGILEELKADIICFQEMKSSRSGLPRDVALPENFDSFFSFPVSKGGYSGVAVYTDSRKIVPLKAEEGISGRLQPKPPLSATERVSQSYPSVSDINAFPDEDGNTPATFDALDAEGRGLVIDFGLFVLINVYCPNETSEARTSFKMNYHLLLEARVKQLMVEGREVIVLGDMNICATPMDHCDGHLPSNAKTFWEHPARAWFHKWLDPLGPMVDVVRSYWPERKGLYTCWNTKISARETNYGTRVDYILVTKGLLRWIKHGDIQPALKGSDHCPIYIDLHDEIVLESGERLTLHEAMQLQGSNATKREPPRVAAKYWEEFSGKQTLLSTFFTKGATGRTSTSVIQNNVTTLSASPSENSPPDPSQAAISTSESPAHESKPPIRSSQSRIIPNTKKRKSASSALPSSSSKKPKKPAAGQASLASFFSKPKVSPSAQAASTSSSFTEVIDVDAVVDDDSPAPSQLDEDHRLALESSTTADYDDPSTASPSSQPSSSQSKAAWSSLFTPLQPPKCTVHNEPTKKHTVNKAGPNKGRTFYVCSRPVGPGYDKGKGERLRNEVDHQYRCNYFKWASDVKRDAAGGSTSDTTTQGNVTRIGS